ncbi:MAG TPA: adventurous gliding motility protein CglE [Myxococcota bacterium]|nr:adventurous gliding motility protein CglE [Myxococcota bacterium]
MRAISRALAPIAAVILLAASGAQAAGPSIQKFMEIERGFWLRSTFGIDLAVVNAFGSGSRSSSIYPPNPVVSLEMGVDFGQVASIHLNLLCQQIAGSRDIGTRGSVPNDSTAIGILAGGRFNIMTTKRLGWFVKAEVGYLLAVPDTAKLGNGLVVQGGTGIEYATSLRHFFIGIEAGAQYLIANGGLGILLTPTVKYVF